MSGGKCKTIADKRAHSSFIQNFKSANVWNRTTVHETSNMVSHLAVVTTTNVLAMGLKWQWSSHG
jgi:hypothetical protein